MSRTTTVSTSKKNDKLESTRKKKLIVQAEAQVIRSSSIDNSDTSTVVPPPQTNEVNNTEPSYETSIWKWAATEKESCSGKRGGANEISTLFIVGNKGSGKTSLINCFLDKTDNNVGPRPTLALDFSFARRTTSDFVKQICHIWELGGDVINYYELMDPPITCCRCLEKMSLVIVLDLSEPNNIWATLEASLFHAKKAISRSLEFMDKGDALVLTQELEKKMATRLRDAVQDKDNLDPFPIPVIIIGTKYDIFQSFEPDKRKTICRLLRIASHHFGASLNFYSKAELSLNRRIRELFCYCAFDTTFPKEICLDMMSKPLLIPFGGDSFQQIWPGVSPTQFTLDYCRHLYETKIGKSNVKFIASENPSLDPNFKEYEIDQQRTAGMEKLAERERLPPGVAYSTSENVENNESIVRQTN